MQLMSNYDKNYYDHLRRFSLPTAQVVVPLVLEACNPRSVVDLGCGIGAWLSVFHEHGVEDVLGVDGPWVDVNKLMIEPSRFRAHSLTEPLKVERAFDLALSLEVAEHLHEVDADTFMDSLVSLSEVIVFSAAIPFQGGTNHYNEQYPSYWAKKFNARGYVTIDYLRKRIWDNKAVASSCAQNTLVYVKEPALKNYPRLREAYESIPAGGIDLIHPDYVARVAKRYWRARLKEKWVDAVKWPFTTCARLLNPRRS